MKIKDFCKDVGVDYSTFWDYYKRRTYIPLFILKELEGVSKRRFQKHIDYLESGVGHTKNNSKAVRYKSENLAKILGAYAADGYLRDRTIFWNGKETTHFELVFREGFKSNVRALANWFNDVFGISPKIRKEKNHYYIYISNKIIFRYFTNIFGFTPGRKTETVSVPEFLKKSSKSLKKSFISGVLMFDGSVGNRNGYIELCCKSKALLEDMIVFLKEICIDPDYVSLAPDRFMRYRFRIRKIEKLKRCLGLFETDTEKWWRLKEHLYGFEHKTKSIDYAISNIGKYYPDTMTDILKVIYLFQKQGITTDFSNISKSLNKCSTVVYEYLRKLERLGILKTKKHGQRKTWFLSSEIPYPKRRR